MGESGGRARMHLLCLALPRESIGQSFPRPRTGRPWHHGGERTLCENRTDSSYTL